MIVNQQNEAHEQVLQFKLAAVTHLLLTRNVRLGGLVLPAPECKLLCFSFLTFLNHGKGFADGGDFCSQLGQLCTNKQSTKE